MAGFLWTDGSAALRGPAADEATFRFGRFCVCLVLTLFTAVASVFFFVLLPGLQVDHSSKKQLGMLGIFLFVNLLSNYLMAVRTDPGITPEFEEGSALLAAERRCSSSGNGDDEEQGETPGQCGKCSRAKPPRSHHCRVCDRCVLRMDHHCPWINNCLGFHNYRSFCVFVGHLSIACCIVLLTTFDTTVNTIFYPEHCGYEDKACMAIACCYFACLLTLATLSCVGGTNAYLVLTNQTTIEVKVNEATRDKLKWKRELAKLRRRESEHLYYQSPYDLGRWRNYQEIFGRGFDGVLCWLVPGLASPPLGDGLSYPQADRKNTGEDSVPVAIGLMIYFQWGVLFFLSCHRFWRLARQ